MESFPIFLDLPTFLIEPFPIFRLPHVALREVLRSLTPIELLLLSQCSRKVCNTIPIAGTQNFFLSVEFQNSAVKINREYRFETPSFWKTANFDIKTNNNTKTAVNYLPYVNTLQFVGENRKIGLMNIAIHLSDVFKCPIKLFESQEYSHGVKIRAMLSEIMHRQNNKIENVFLRGFFKNEDLKWILENLKVTGTLTVAIDPVDTFQTSIVPVCDRFVSFPATWISLDMILSFNSTRMIKMSLSRLNHHDIDIFVHAWKAGHFPILEYFWTSTSGEMEGHSIMGVSFFKLKTKQGASRDKIIDGEKVGECERGVDVQADDGTKGTIALQKDAANVYIFELFVWRD